MLVGKLEYVCRFIRRRSFVNQLYSMYITVKPGMFLILVSLKLD